MRKTFVLLIGAALLLSAPVAFAQEEGDGDELDGLEMDVMGHKGTPNAASTKVLALPDEASDTARERAQKGLDTANRAREDGAQFGEDTADAAREAHGDAGGDHGPPDEPGRP